MKKAILLVSFMACAITLSSYQSPTVTVKDATTEKLSNSSISAQTKAVSKEEIFVQAEAVSKDEISVQTEAVVKDELANSTSTDLNFEEIYDSFLSGQIDAIDKDGVRRNIDYYLRSNSSGDVQEYAVYDMNGDAIPELIIKSRISLDIFWIYNNELTLWHSDTAYARPLNNMALLYERAGGGPEHTDYMYTVLGYQGEELYKINFSEYSNCEVNSIQYDNKYFIDDTEVTKESYESLSEQYLNIGDDKIEWKSFSN